ncbi:MAG: hypothetical protein U0175_26265 [Caldilineaceae bacterium]
MIIDSIQPKDKALTLATNAEIDSVENHYWFTFPRGYREYITTFGEGILDSYIRIYPPWRIARELGDWRRRIFYYWFWDQGREILPKERALECVILGDTLDGDEIVFHPARPGQLFLLPHGNEQIYAIGKDIFDALEWLCTSGEITEPLKERDFEPFDSRSQTTPEGITAKKIADPSGETLDEILETAQRWSERHPSKIQIEQILKQLRLEGKELKLLHEGVFWKTTSPFALGYNAVYHIFDSQSGVELGTFTFNKDGTGSYGSNFSPNKENMAKLQK